MIPKFNYTKGSKYKNKKVVVNGIQFDSKKEAKRYQELILLESAGQIKDLQLQPEFIIIPTLKKDWLPRTIAKTKYIADFCYIETKSGQKIVEDVKGFKTDVYQLKKKLFIHQYCEDIIFKEV